MIDHETLLEGVLKYCDIVSHCSVSCNSDGTPISTDGLFHYVYCTINTINGKFYIGKHTYHEEFDLNYYGSGKYLRNAINKYGFDRFYRYIVSYHTSSNNAYEYEKSLITEEMIISDQCYNMSSGGDGFSSGSLNHNIISSKLGKHPMHLRALEGKQSKLVWWLADEIFYKLYTRDIFKYATIIKNLRIEQRFPHKLSRWSLRTLYDYLDSKWRPWDDKDWIKFRLDYDPGAK